MKRSFAGRRAALIAATAMVPLAIATASAQAATASPAQASSTASTTPAVACSGTTPYTKSISSATSTATEHGFYFTNSNPQVCVGQANLRENFNDNGDLAERVRVHSGGAGGTLIYQALNTHGSGQGTGTLDFTTGVNMLFNVAQVTVCVALVNQSDGSVVDGVVICKTLG
jgi:predicted membrane-bound mannosyltransferase